MTRRCHLVILLPLLSVGAVFGNAVIQQLQHPHALAAGVMHQTGPPPE